MTVTADEFAVEDASNNYKTLRSVALTIAGTSVGANALDAGTIAASTWYSVWAIYNPTTQTTAGLLSLSATAPTLPSGYTHKARVGWIRTDGTANKYPLSFKQYGRQVRYVVATGSNVAAFPSMASGVAGAPGTPTYVAIGVSAFVPPTAGYITVMYCHLSSDANINVIVSPNNNTGALLSGTNPPPFNYTNTTAGGTSLYPLTLGLESTNIYWANNNGNGALRAQGWEDNL